MSIGLFEEAKREWLARVGSPLASELGAFESGFNAAITSPPGKYELYGFIRENDGRLQASIGKERPADRAGGYATPWSAIYVRSETGGNDESRWAMRAGVEKAAREEVEAENSQLRKDAERWRFVRDLPCNHLYLTRNDEHAPNYRTAAEWIEETAEDYIDTPADELERMKATNTIWNFQVYPNTPVGFNRWYGATAEAAVDAAMREYT